MLNRMRNSLSFPKLIFLGDVDSGKEERCGRYKLDWDFFDQKMQQQYSFWRNKWWSEIDLPEEVAPSLPEKYEKTIKEIQFIIPDRYYHEIQRSALQAVVEWSRFVYFETNIRDIIHAPSVAYTKCAFELLLCCVDGELPEDKLIILTSMLYKFWAHQTSRNIASRNAGVFEMYNESKNIERRTGDSSINDKVSVFKKAIRELEEEYHKNYSSKKKAAKE